MTKNLNLLIVFAAMSIFVVGCSEERSVAPAETASPTESSDEQNDDGATIDPAGSSTNEAGSGL